MAAKKAAQTDARKACLMVVAMAAWMDVAKAAATAYAMVSETADH